MTVDKIGEFGLIDRIKCRFAVPEGVEGIGDDCAILPQQEGMVSLVSTDLLVEGVHFLREDIPPQLLGWKSAAVNLSDVAAMGGRPIGTFLSIALPHNVETDWVDCFIDGYKEISDLFNTPLLGGDTTSSLDRICINVGVMGVAQKGYPKKRSTAQVGDLVCVTGPLGDSACGLQIILNHLERNADEKHLVERHYRPMPRVEMGLLLAQNESVHAMMDISDGIGSDLRHILKASKVGAKVDVKRIPLSAEMQRVCVSQGWDPLDFAIGGGEDYELLFTASPDVILPECCVAIGVITDEADALEWIDTAKNYKGFCHF